jgi:hypothetical protein
MGAGMFRVGDPELIEAGGFWPCPKFVVTRSEKKEPTINQWPKKYRRLLMMVLGQKMFIGNRTSGWGRHPELKMILTNK